MGGEAIAAGALGRDGLWLLTHDFGRTRLAEILRAPREPRAGAVEEDGAEKTGAAQAVHATRP